MLIAELDKLIAAACPIDGIDSAGGISFKPEATPAQRAAAQTLMAQHHADLAALPPAPASVTMRQARLALLQAGHLAAVTAALAATPGMAGEAARIEWEYASTLERDSPLVQAFAAQLGLTGADLDALFTAAATL